MNTSGKNLSRFFFPSHKDDLSSNRQRQLIGIIGLLFPVLLWLVASLRPEEGLRPWKLLSSVSGYYYTGAVSVFAGILITLAIFLFSYRGYDNSYSRLDRVAAIVAGVAAVLVALFPTGAPEGLKALHWWTPPIGIIHYLSAVILFFSFIFFSLVLFRKSQVKQGESFSRGKRIRNGIYIFCGVAMLGCMIWAGIAGIMDSPIFWPEALALEFFAVSWLVKGRADMTAIAVSRRTLYYTRHPKQLFVLRKRTAIE